MAEVLKIDKKDRNAIAEYVHAHETDTLIVPEAIDAVSALARMKLIDNNREEVLLNNIKSKSPGISQVIFNLIQEKISKDTGMAIMEEYYGTKPYPND